MNIKERLVRRNLQDVIEIGDIVRRAYNGKFGEILRANINGLVTKEIMENQNNRANLVPLSADRILGRVEAYNNVLLNLEAMIEDSDKLQQPIENDEEEVD